MSVLPCPASPFRCLPAGSRLSRLSYRRSCPVDLGPDERQAFPSARGRVRPTVEFITNPAFVTDILQRPDNGGVVTFSAPHRHEGERLALPALQMHIADTRGMFAHHGSGVAAGRRQMTRVRAEVDAGPCE